MSAWPGGKCPDCGDEVPALVLRCRTCGATLNSDLEIPTIAPPERVVLQEIAPVIEVAPRGSFVGCPNCERELRIASHYEGQTVQCKFCTAPFVFKRSNPAILRFARFLECPHCHKELRVAEKYVGQNVACKFCDGEIRIVDQA